MRTARALLVLAAVTCGVISRADASSLATATDGIGAGAVAIGRCTSAGLSVLPNLAGATVVSVTVASLPAGCGNATLEVTVHNGLTSSSGTATVPAGGGSVTVPLALAIALLTSVETDLVLVGP